MRAASVIVARRLPLPAALRHLLLFLLVTAGLGVFSPSASAESQVIWPEVGFGAGRIVTGFTTSPALQFDFSMGFEHRGRTWSQGGIVRFDMLLMDEAYRYDLAPMVTWSLGFPNGAPFFRAGVGPLLSITDGPGFTAFGGGGHGELSVGFKSILDLYVNARMGIDPTGPSMAFTSGVRINAAVLWFLSSWGRWRRW